MQKSYSPTDLLSGGNWLAEMGLISTPTADNLLGYAYMQPGVVKADVKIEYDTGDSHLGSMVTYTVKLNPSFYRRYMKLSKYVKETGLWAKFMVYWYLKLGIPFPGTIEDNISFLVQGLLPAYKVSVNVERA